MLNIRGGGDGKTVDIVGFDIETAEDSLRLSWLPSQLIRKSMFIKQG